MDTMKQSPYFANVHTIEFRATSISALSVKALGEAVGESPYMLNLEAAVFEQNYITPDAFLLVARGVDKRTMKRCMTALFSVILETPECHNHHLLDFTAFVGVETFL